MCPELEVKQFVCEIEDMRGTRFFVFKTGDTKFYLFSLRVCEKGAPPGAGYDSGVHIPVRKTELKRGVVSMKYGTQFGPRRLDGSLW